MYIYIRRPLSCISHWYHFHKFIFKNIVYCIFIRQNIFFNRFCSVYRIFGSWKRTLLFKDIFKYCLFLLIFFYSVSSSLFSVLSCASLMSLFVLFSSKFLLLFSLKTASTSVPYMTFTYAVFLEGICNYLFFNNF